MTCEEDVSQYRKEFIYYIDPLVHSRHLTEYEWDVEFWYGFHPRNRDLLFPRLFDLCPFQLHVPFRSEDTSSLLHTLCICLRGITQVSVARITV